MASNNFEAGKYDLTAKVRSSKQCAQHASSGARGGGPGRDLSRVTPSERSRARVPAGAQHSLLLDRRTRYTRGPRVGRGSGAMDFSFSFVSTAQPICPKCQVKRGREWGNTLWGMHGPRSYPRRFARALRPRVTTRDLTRHSPRLVTRTLPHPAASLPPI
jgi:hypothetical protein